MAYQHAHAGLRPSDLSTLLYTSGTRGQPKGVMLSHDAWIYQAGIESPDLMTPADIQLLFLPLSHVFAKTMQVVFIRLGVPTLVDSNMERLESNLSDCKPTWFATVPLVLEQMRARVHGWLAAASQAARLPSCAGCGAEAATLSYWRPVPSHLKARQLVAERVLAAAARRLGGRLRFIVCGGAPLDPDVVTFFHAIGIPILQGYGLTESAGAATVNRLMTSPANGGTTAARNKCASLSPARSRFETGPSCWGTTAKLAATQPRRAKAAGSRRATSETAPRRFARDPGRKKSILVTSAGKNICEARAGAHQLVAIHSTGGGRR